MSEEEILSPQKAYHASGVGHCNCALIIHHHLVRNNIDRTDSTWIALNNVIAFAAEATLKAYLAKHGIDRAALSKRKPYGHDLRALHAKAVEFGLAEDGIRLGETQLADAIGRFIDLCGEDYLSFNYRYIERENLAILQAGMAVITVIEALRRVLDLCELETTR